MFFTEWLSAGAIKEKGNAASAPVTGIETCLSSALFAPRFFSGTGGDKDRSSINAGNKQNPQQKLFTRKKTRKLQVGHLICFVRMVMEKQFTVPQVTRGAGFQEFCLGDVWHEILLL